MSEFFLILGDSLEKQMKGTTVSGTYSELFEGVVENVVSCMHINYESTRRETFNSLQLNTKDVSSVADALQLYVASEDMVGAN